MNKIDRPDAVDVADNSLHAKLMLCVWIVSVVAMAVAVGMNPAIVQD